MHSIHTIDLNFGTDECIAVFLIKTATGAILIESGPESTWQQLTEGLALYQLTPNDIQHVFLTHIHFDHAGAAWRLAHAGAIIHVHPIGLPHLQNPEKLWNSAKQIYGDNMERLWGEMQAIPASQLHPVDDGDIVEIGDISLEVIYTPGHAIHHNAYKIENIIFTGDVAGVKIENGLVQAPCPPPDINIENWLVSLAKLKARNAAAFYLTHFGKQDNPNSILEQLSSILKDWSEWIKAKYDIGESIEAVVPQFEKYTLNKMQEAGMSAHEISRYEYANPVQMSVTGLYRYWKLKEQGRI